jgi:hypothetical protein
LLWLVSGVLASEVIVLIVRDVFSAGIQGRAKSFIGYTSLFLVILSLRIGIPGLAKSISPFRIAGFLVFLLWLAILPFVTAAGTTHKIFINALLHAAPISAAVLLLASSIDKDLRKSIVVPFATLLLVCMGFSQFVDGFLVTPYRTAPKWTQTVPVKVGVPATILKLDPESAECIEKTKRALESAGFQPGDDVLALYGLPGLVYAVGGVSPQRPWFFVYGTPGHEENLGALQRISRNRFQKSYVFLNDKNDVAMSQLTICGFSLKEQWQNVGDVKVPFKNQTFGIFKPSH